MADDDDWRSHLTDIQERMAPKPATVKPKKSTHSRRASEKERSDPSQSRESSVRDLGEGAAARSTSPRKTVTPRVTPRTSEMAGTFHDRSGRDSPTNASVLTEELQPYRPAPGAQGAPVGSINEATSSFSFLRGT